MRNSDADHPTDAAPARVPAAIASERAAAGPAASAPARRYGAGRGPAEDTDLERRVLAHERILQSLIAHMAETEPGFLVRLNERFSEPMQLVRHEHDFMDTDSYAEAFMRAVVRSGKAAPVPRKAAGKPAAARVPFAEPAERASVPPGVVIREKGGVWQVVRDGRFHGEYLRRDLAMAAARKL